MGEERVLLVDGDNLLVRAVMATQGKPMTAGEVETGPLVVFVNTLSRYVREIQPTRMVVCWDHGPCHWRLALHPGYKANRPEHTEEDTTRRGSARKLAREFLSLAGIHHTDRLGYEADDLIAAYWHRHPKETKFILSSDKDLLQLVDEHTKQIRVSSADTPTDVWDVSRVFEKYGTCREGLTMAMALIGDVSDGIPGVHGIGPKTAVKLLDKAGWDFASIQDPRVAKDLENVWTWYQLVDLCVLTENRPVVPDVPLFRPTSVVTAGYEDIVRFLETYGINSILKRLQQGSLWR